MNYLWFTVAWAIGLFAGAFFLIQALIVLFFGIPFTMRLRRLGIIRGRGPLIPYLGSLIVLPLLFLAISAGVLTWLPDAQIGYWIGVVIVFWLGRGRCGANATNVQEYLETNAEYFDIEALRRHFPNQQPT